MDDELRGKLEKAIADLDLSVRASNCLEAARILTVGDLVRMTEDELLQLRSFGKTSLMEVKSKLAGLGLSLGMHVPPPASGEDHVTAGEPAQQI